MLSILLKTVPISSELPEITEIGMERSFRTSGIYFCSRFPRSDHLTAYGFNAGIYDRNSLPVPIGPDVKGHVQRAKPEGTGP